MAEHKTPRAFETPQTTRRETLKLAAAIAAFGAALGFSAREANADQHQLKKERFEYKFERLELKFYHEGKLLHSCSAPDAVRKELKRGRKLELKWYRDGMQVSDPHM